MKNNKALFETLNKNNGLSVHSDGRTVSTNGFAVSLPDYETVILETTLDLNLFNDLIGNYLELSKQLPSSIVGVWKDSGKVFFDISTVVKDKNTAIKLGKHYKQLAIFDLSNKEVISLK